jgi:hypothetical protein
MSKADVPRGSASEPFMPSADRPEPKPDTRIADLTVRDLLGVLQASGSVKAVLKYEHSELKFIYTKHEQYKIEQPKPEMHKFEHPDIPNWQSPGGPGPEVNALAQGIAGLQAQVHQLSSEVAELRKARRR